MKFILHKKTTGFTVFELLLVMAIIGILVSISLASLTNLKENNKTKEYISNIKRIEVGLAEFYQACGHYPSQLHSWTTCDKLQLPAQSLIGGLASAKQLSDFIEDIDSFNFNHVGSSQYYYAGIGFDSSLVSNPDCATGYHIAVYLDTPNKLSEDDSGYDSRASGVNLCYEQIFPGAPFNVIPSGITATNDPRFYDKLMQR